MTRGERRSDGAALVTGASSGIGRELADVVAADGYDVVLVARREERLTDLVDDLESEFGVAATALPVDLGEPGAAGTVATAVAERDVDVDLLVNNAGVARAGRFDETSLAADRETLRVNVAALTALTKRFVRPMVDRGAGGILNVASIAGEAPHPEMPVYAATKAYVLSLSRALARQFGPLGVAVTALSPGWTDTATGRRMADATGSDVRGWMDPARVARAGYDGLVAGDPVVIPGESNRRYVRDVHADRVSELD